MAFTVQFEAELWRWKGDAAWHFVTVPPEPSAEVDDRVPHRTGFGSVKVTATLGVSTWTTSIFPADKGESFVLPVKRQVRDANDLLAGDRVEVLLEVASDD